MARVVLAASLAATAAAQSGFPGFDEWQAQWGKNYDADETAQRREIYASNLERMEELNSEGMAVYAPDEHADLTLAEWREVRGITSFKAEPHDGSKDQCHFPTAEGILSSEEVESLAETYIDWVAKGAVTHVKNQGSSGTCGYFSAITVMEGINVVQGGNKLEALSEQEVIDCCTPGFGNCNGWPGEEIRWYAGTDPKKGSVFAKTEKSYPYKGARNIPMPDGTPCHSSQGTPTKATSADRICTGLDPAVINAHLNTMGPAVWMIDATCLQGYSHGIISASRCAGSGGTWPHYSGIDHATTIVGSGEENGVVYWKVKNSWGAGFGEQGYYRVKQDAAGTTKPMLHAIGAIFGKFPTSVTV